MFKDLDSSNWPNMENTAIRGLFEGHYGEVMSDDDLDLIRLTPLKYSMYGSESSHLLF